MGADGVYFEKRPVWEKGSEICTRILPSILPDQIRSTVRGMILTEVALGFGHFALLFVDRNRPVRRIVTDTQLFEFDGVYGYVYLDITQDGKPIARSCCDNGGGRAFFDGVRLMSHPRFQTCAPRTVIFDSGYMLNSTHCTIINGQLFDLLIPDDEVAKTDGAFMGMVDFSRAQMVQSCKLGEATRQLLTVSGDRVRLGDTELKPIGRFMPSRVELLDSGFSHYHWSAYYETQRIRFDSVLVVDDNQGWIDRVINDLGSEVRKLTSVQTSSAEEALATILELNPEAVLLDIHLTPDERFEGLWIGSQLARRGFDGAVIITSGVSEQSLRAMRQLIPRAVAAPGKDLAKIRIALAGQEI